MKEKKEKKPNKVLNWIKERFSFVAYPTDLKGGFKWKITFKF